MTMKKDLKAIKKEIKVLSKKVEKIYAIVSKLKKPKPVKKIAKAKPVKKTVAKKTPPKSKPTKMVTAADTVFAVIKELKNGANAATLVEKTGFNRQKIYDSVKILKKKGMVKSPEKGIYVKT